MIGTLICADCGQEAPRRHELATRCRKCHRNKPSQRARRHELWKQKYGNRWTRKSQRVRKEVGRCEFCGATDDLTTDHIVPLVEGGGHERANLRVLCRPCHEAVTELYQAHKIIAA